MRFKKKDFTLVPERSGARRATPQSCGRGFSRLVRRRDGSVAWGFTLVEVLVVMAIMAIMTGIFLARQNLQSDSQTLEQAAQRLISELRRAQGMAVTGAQETGGLIKAGGYGIRDNNAGVYVLYVNDAADSGSGCSSGTEASLLTISLPAGVAISNSFGAGADVFFSPPEPKTCINGNSDNEEIVYTLALSGLCKKIKVTKYGQIGQINCP